MINVNDTVDQVVQPFVMLNDRIISKGYTFHCICGGMESWKEFVEKKYIEGSKQIFYLGGDYEYELDFIDNKQDAVFMRQSFLASKKKNNEILIPSSYGCIAGNKNMELCKITEKPKISFCGTKNSHPCRPPLFTMLENNQNILCDFSFTDMPCCGAVDPEINKKAFDFNENLKYSEFVFCPRGNGNFSIRFYEALLSGRIPVILKTDNELPFHKHIHWDKLCVISENSTTLINDIINFHKKYDLIEIQKNCKKTFQKYFIDNFVDLLFMELESKTNPTT